MSLEVKENKIDENVCENLLKGGIYKITNLVNGKVYIGSTKDFKSREYKHFNKLTKGNHHNKHLQRAFNKYGSNNFVFSIVESLKDENKLIEREQYWLDKTKSYIKENGYNIRIKADSNLGLKQSEEAKEKVRLFHTGRKRSEETRLNISKSKLGMKLSEKHLKNLRKPKSTDGFQKGENNTSSKLTEEDVKEIKLLLQKGLEHQEIAKKFNVTAGTITSIKNGKNWGYVKVEGIDDEQLKKYRHPRYGSKLDKEKVKDIKRLLKEGIKGSVIADLFGVARVTIYDIKSGKTWKNVNI